MRIAPYLYATVVFGAAAIAAQASSGSVNFSVLTQPTLDTFFNSPTSSSMQWFQKYMVRMGVFSPYFDQSTSWYGNALIYLDLYGIHSGTDVYYQHPEWIMHDQNGHWLYIPFNCSGTCTSYAGDLANPNFRAWWISQAQAALARGNYRGLWIDDVNMNFNVSDGNGNLVAPIDYNTGKTMTYDAWRSYVAAFLQQIKQALPNRELIENAVWFAGPTGVQSQDQYVQAGIKTATNINMERGIASDPGATGGTGPWSVYTQFKYVDLVHALGPSVTFEEYQVNSTQQQYGLASYFMISNGSDRIGDMSTSPNNWWSGYTTDLGPAQGARTYNNGVFQRNFQNGIVLLGEPGLASTKVSLPGVYKGLDGTIYNYSATIGAKQGLILLGQGSSSTPSAPSTPSSPPPSSSGGVTRYLSSITPAYVFQSWGSPQDNTSVTGNPITLNGTTYQYGLGVHAYSELQWPMYGNCWTLSATVGVDDEVPNGNANLEFQVWADGHQLWNSGYMTASTASRSFQVSLNGYQTLGLVVTNGIFRASASQVPMDHADWANAIITCAH